MTSIGSHTTFDAGSCCEHWAIKNVVVGVGELNRFRITDSKGGKLGSRRLNIAQFEGQRLEFLFKPRRANHSQGLCAQQCPRKFSHRWPPRVGYPHHFAQP